MKILLTTLNAKYIHKNLALRWIYQARPQTQQHVILKEYTIKDDIPSIKKDILQQEYDIICFSVYIWNIEYIKELIQALKQSQPSVKILVGGPEVSYESEDLLECGVDAISIGEGEQSVWEYIQMLEQNRSYEISGICTRQHPNHDKRITPLSYLEQLDDPYFMEADASDMDKRYLYLETSRGCPYGCEYCLSSCDRNVRLFSLPYVMKLLEKLKYSSVTQVKLLDRTFNSAPKRALTIARYMNEHCRKQSFQLEVVAEALSEDLLQFFEHEADSKRFRLEIGVQSFHEPTLKSVGRIQNNKRLREVIARLKKANITMHVDLIAGLPYEDKATFRQSFDQLFALAADECQLGLLKLLKGTRLKQKADQYGFVFEAHAPYTIQETSWLTKAELQDIASCAQAVEKYWNSGKCRYTVNELLSLGYQNSAFQLFEALGKEYRKLKHPYAPQQLFQAFMQAMPEIDQLYLAAMLNIDYYRNVKQRPAHFHSYKLNHELRSQLKEAAKQYGISAYSLDHYSMMGYGWIDHTLGYQLIIFDRLQQETKRYWCDTTLKNWKEILE